MSATATTTARIVHMIFLAVDFGTNAAADVVKSRLFNDETTAAMLNDCRIGVGFSTKNAVAGTAFVQLTGETADVFEAMVVCRESMAPGTVSRMISAPEYN